MESSKYKNTELDKLLKYSIEVLTKKNESSNTRKI